MTYLRHVRNIWEHILDYDSASFTLLDVMSVSKLQGRCPGLSLEDQGYITSLFESNELFSRIQDQQLLSRIRSKLSSTECIILSLHTFLEDTKLLEPCSKILRQLLPSSWQGSIHAGLAQCLLPSDSQDALVEHGAEDFVVLKDEKDFRLWCGYRELWLFALRNFPFMGIVKPRKDRHASEPFQYRESPQRWYKLAKLADKLGFASTEIERLSSSDPLSSFVQHIMSDLNHGKEFHSNGAQLSNKVQKL